MKQFEKFSILATENFMSTNFTFLKTEMAVVCKNTANLSNVFKSNMIISFLKSHSVKNNWMIENPEMAEMIASGRLVAYRTEALFEGCRSNSKFTKDLESYLNELINSSDKQARVI